MSKPAAIIGARQLFLLPSIVIAAAIVCGLQAEDSSSNDCDGQRLNVLTARRGLIRSPNFPKRFPVPIHCRWLIDASASANLDSVVIYVYFTQLFVTSGLSITEYPYFDVESRTGFYGKQIFNAAQDNVLRYEFSRTNCTYLLIDFQLDVLEGNHLRVLYHLMDVYGFNITYEITRDEPSEKRCTVSDCSLVGHCYANQNFSSYACSCFPGFVGENCGYGPLCQPYMNSCENGATCRYAGETTVICQCTEGFTGSKCDTPIRNVSGFGCTTVAEGCALQCRYNEDDNAGKDSDELPCSCRNRTILGENSGDTAMYLLTLHLNNLTSILEKPWSAIAHDSSDAATSTRSGELLQHHRQHQQHAMYTKIQYEIGKYMKKAKLSKVENIEITDVIRESGHSATASLRVFAGKEDRNKLKETINQMAEKAIISSSYNISQLPALRLVKISTNIKDNSVLEGEEFIISCTAEGTSNISFQLYKDNVPITISIANRGMWSHVVQLHNSRYTMMLAIEHADIDDSGLYTCQVKDNGFEHCHSITVSILQLPRIKLNPLSITTEKGQNLSIKCLSINEFHNGIKFGYTWLRNDNLMKASIPELYWEDLYRGGSVLYINNIQNSETFRCNVQAIGSQMATVYIDVLNKTETAYCEKDGSWPATSAGVVALQECPENYSDDTVSRLCLTTDSHSAQWQLPDYSKCLSNNFSVATKNFRSLLLGYENASITASATLLSIEKLLRDRSSGGFFPGEGEPIVTFLQTICGYLIKSAKFTDLMNATSSFYGIIDLVIGDPLAVVNANLIFNLSELIRKWTSFWLFYETALNKKSNISDDSTDIFNFTSFTLFFPKYFGQVLKFADGLRIKIENSPANKSLNYSANTAIIVYKNFSHRFVSQFISHPWKKENLLFEIKSPVINVIHSERVEYEDKINQSTFIEVQYKLPTVMQSKDNPVNLNICCGRAHHFGQSWKLLSCQSTSEITTSSDTVSCSYDADEGLIAIYAAEVPAEKSGTVNCTYHVMVVGGCVVCFVQCALTLGVLIPRWYKIRSCLTYLKMQVCISIASSMILFLFASCNAQPVLYPYILFGLQVFLLAAVSSHISVLIIIYLDVISLSKIPKIKVSAIVVMTVSPMLLAVFAPLSRQITNERLTCWWLCRSTLLLYVHSLVGLFLLILFIFLYYSVIKKLWFLLNVSKSERKTLIDRASFVQCTLLIFLTTAVVAMSSTVYVNSSTSVSQCVFGSSSVLLGFLVAISYIPRNETLFCGRIYPKMTTYNDKINDKYSPELQIISTTAADVGYKQDNCIDDTSSPECSSHLEIKNERNSIHANSYRLHKNRSIHDSTIGLIKSPLLNDRLKNENDVALKRHAESELHHEGTQQEKPDILLPVTCNNYVNPAICNAANSFHSSLTRCMTDNEVKNSSPEMLTTRLCVELGVMKSSLHENANKINDGTTENGGGTLLICSVDVEPCPGHVIELNEVKFTTAINAAVATVTSVPPDKQEQTVLSNKSSFSPSAIGDSCNHTDGGKDVLDRISQDLDYLLNNKNSDNESKLK